MDLLSFTAFDKNHRHWHYSNEEDKLLLKRHEKSWFDENLLEPTTVYQHQVGSLENALS